MSLYGTGRLEEEGISTGGIASYVIPGSPLAKSLGASFALTVRRIATNSVAKAKKAASDLSNYIFRLEMADWYRRLYVLPLRMENGGTFFASALSVASVLGVSLLQVRNLGLTLEDTLQAYAERGINDPFAHMKLEVA